MAVSRRQGVRCHLRTEERCLFGVFQVPFVEGVRGRASLSLRVHACCAHLDTHPGGTHRVNARSLQERDRQWGTQSKREGINKKGYAIVEFHQLWVPVGAPSKGQIQGFIGKRRESTASSKQHHRLRAHVLKHCAVRGLYHCARCWEQEITLP